MYTRARGPGERNVVKEVRIRYQLSAEGRRADLLAGGSGVRHQYVTVPATRELLEMADIADDGSATIDLPGTKDGFYDEPVRDVMQEVDAWTRRLARMHARNAEAERATFEQIISDLLGHRERWKRVFLFTENPDEVVAHDRDDLSGTSRRIPKQYVTRQLLAVAQHETEERNRELEREAAEEKERKRARRAEMESWVDQYGSTRLKKCKSVGMLADCVGIYRAERLEREIPGARWDGDKYEDDHVNNPSEAALDKLIELRNRYPNADLIRQRTPSGKWETCIRFDVPWNDTAYAVLPVKE